MRVRREMWNPSRSVNPSLSEMKFWVWTTRSVVFCDDFDAFGKVERGVEC
jgi:hypothetical protein